MFYIFYTFNRPTYYKTHVLYLLYLYIDQLTMYYNTSLDEPRQDISNNVVHVCATSKASDQPAHTRSLIKTYASRLNILRVLSY